MGIRSGVACLSVCGACVKKSNLKAGRVLSCSVNLSPQLGMLSPQPGMGMLQPGVETNAPLLAHRRCRMLKDHDERAIAIGRTDLRSPSLECFMGVEGKGSSVTAKLRVDFNIREA